MKKQLKLRDAAVMAANKSMIDHRNWSVSKDRTDGAKTKKLAQGDGFEVLFVDQKSGKPVRTGGVNCKVQLLPGEYNLELNADPSNNFRIYLYGADGKEIDADGKPAEQGKAKINVVNGKNTFHVPDGCVSIGLFALVSPTQEKVTVSQIAFKPVDEENQIVAAGK